MSNSSPLEILLDDVGNPESESILVQVQIERLQIMHRDKDAKLLLLDELVVVHIIVEGSVDECAISNSDTSTTRQCTRRTIASDDLDKCYPLSIC